MKKGNELAGNRALANGHIQLIPRGLSPLHQSLVEVISYGAWLLRFFILFYLKFSPSHNLVCLRRLYLKQRQKTNFVREVKKGVLNVLWKHIGEGDKKIFDILCPSEIAYQRLGQLHWFHKMVLLWESFPGPANPVTVVWVSSSRRLLSPKHHF